MSLNSAQGKSFKLVEHPNSPVFIPPINETLNQKGFYISYCFSSRDYGEPTTALVLESPTMRFLILKGNHKKEYATMCKGSAPNSSKLRECLKYFEDNKHLKHKLSE